MSAAVLRVQKRKMVELPIAVIKTDGVAKIRELYQPENLNNLSTSISEVGVMEPIVVSREKDGTYELVIGSRRINASLRDGEETVPAIIHEGLTNKTKLIMALSENIHHEDLTPFEEARVFLKLLNEYEMTLKQLAQSIGRGEAAIRSRIKLLQLPPDVQDLMSQRLIGVNTIRIIESLKSPEDQERFARITVDHLLNVQELSALIESEIKKKVSNRKVSRQPITAKKAQLRIASFTSSIRRLMLDVVKMNKKEQVLVKSALITLRREIDGWIEKVELATKVKD